MVGCRQPARRCVLARAGLIAAIAIVPLVAGSPFERFELLGHLERLVPSSHWSVSSSRDETSAVGAQRVSGRSNLTSLQLAHWARRGLTVLYLTGLTTGFVWLGLGSWGAAWLLARSSEPRQSTVELYQMQRNPHPRRSPRLRVAPRITRPVLVGLLRPTILIPASLEDTAGTSPLRLSLLHELAHAERNDALFGFVGNLAQAVWFFLPPVWWIRSQMRLDQEFLADNQASCGFGHSTSYASSLLEIADPRSTAGAGRPTAPNPPAMKSNVPMGSSLFLRVLMLVRCPFPVETRAPAWWRWLLPAVVACGALAASTLSLRREGSMSLQTVAALPSRPAHGTFHVGRLITEPDEQDRTDAPTKPYTLPILLPTEFDLTLEVWATPTDLPLLQIVGHTITPDFKTTAGWHQIRVRRRQAAWAFFLDGHEVPSRAAGPPPARLTLQPAHREPGLFRNLTLQW
jgi:hypothetical protein